MRRRATQLAACKRVKVEFGLPEASVAHDGTADSARPSSAICKEEKSEALDETATVGGLKEVSDTAKTEAEAQAPEWGSAKLDSGIKDEGGDSLKEDPGGQPDPGDASWDTSTTDAKYDPDVKEEHAEETIQMRDYPEPAMLLELLQSGRLAEVAWGMRSQIGLDIAGLTPKDAVIGFLERYTSAQAKCTFKHERCTTGFAAQLLMPEFFDRTFYGFAKTKKEAEISACKACVGDPQVLEAAALLPPSLTAIRRRIALDSSQKQSLSKCGYDTKTFQDEMVQRVYMAFKDMGCRTLLWDDLYGFP